MTPQGLQIITRYKELKNLRKTGSEFGISYERVRQYLVKYEEETNDIIPRSPGGGKKTPYYWSCPKCKKLYKFSYQKTNRVCRVCYINHNIKPDHVYGNWIQQLLNGKTLYRLMLEENIYHQDILLGILAYLKRKNNLELALKLFEKRSVFWIEKKIRWPEFFKKA